MFSKRLAELTADDIRGIIEREVQEDATVELKEALATRDGSPDVWMRDQSGVGNEAKKDICKELIAFANADGGTLILGIAEDGEKRASAIVPIPDCRKLADRLAQSIASTTDPKLVALEYAGIPTEADGGGVCVFRVPQSHRAPHRDTNSRECYTRVGDRSEPMPMRQIQDLVLQRARGLREVTEILDERSERLTIRVPPFEKVFRNGLAVTLHGCAVRATAIPLEDVYVDRIHRNGKFMFDLPLLMSKDADGSSTHVSEQERRNWQPMLRGIQAKRANQSEDFITEHLVTTHGMIESSLHVREDFLENVSPLPVGLAVWLVFRTFVHMLVTAEAFRIRYGRPDMEFALDFEWKLAPGANILFDSPRRRMWSVHKPLEPSNRVLGYEMPPREGLPELLSRLSDDVASSCGTTLPPLYTIDFDRAVESIL